MMREVQYGELDVRIMPSNHALGIEAAQDFAEVVRARLDQQDQVAVILASGNSQLGFIRAVRSRGDIDWSRLVVFHMDEYLGMPETHPASFRRWVHDQLLAYVTPKAFHGLRGDHEPIDEEVRRYSALLQDLAPAICIMGIGENGHLAFNDPPADFQTRELVHVVRLDEACRRQQVGEGHFASVAEMPEWAVSLTVHALLRPSTILVLAPEARKASVVQQALEGPVTPDCPASVLTTVANTRMYLDQESAARLRTAEAPA